MNLLGLYNVHFIFNFTKAAAFSDVHYSAHVNFALFAFLLDRARDRSTSSRATSCRSSTASRCGGT